MPLASYGHALERYEARAGASARYLEAALRLHRLLRDSEGLLPRQLQRPAPPAAAPGPAPLGPDGGEEWARELRLFGHVLERAACLRRCKRSCPPSRCPIRRASCCATSEPPALPVPALCSVQGARRLPGRVAKSAALYSAARPPIPRALRVSGLRLC